MLTNVAFHPRPVTKNRLIATSELNVVELLRFEIIMGEFTFAHVAYHRFAFHNHLPDPSVLDHRYLDTTLHITGSKKQSEAALLAVRGHVIVIRTFTA
ncbi:hypothetical protein [Desulfonatronum thioautotrophicum]|uniref:hypothetical protein n=1 Tax=Desulfonatronum thioautotrophicum TaxID=617001 RepID=UPI00129477E8|nr:hypothetical protein [Desulfonatronum thioautotrophicum]